MFDEQSGVLLIWWAIQERLIELRAMLYRQLLPVRTQYRVYCTCCDRRSPWASSRELAQEIARGCGFAIFPTGPRPFAACRACLSERLIVCSGARNETGCLEGTCSDSERVQFSGPTPILWTGWVQRPLLGVPGELARFACAACAKRDARPESAPEASS